MSSHLRLMGDYTGAVDAGARAEAIASALGDAELQILARIYLGQAYFATAQYDRGIEVFTRSVEFLTGRRLRERYGFVSLPSVLSRVYLVWCLAERGEFAEAMARGKEGVDIAESADNPYSVALAHEGLGLLYLRKGDLSEAIGSLERALAEARTRQLQLEIAPFTSRLGSAYVRSGRIAEGLSLLEEGLRLADRERSAAYVHQEILLSEGYLLAARLDEATRTATHALELAASRRERGQQAWALRLLGVIASSADPPDVGNAAANYDQALALADELGMRPLAALCRLGLGHVCRLTGEETQAREHLLAAKSAFRAMDMKSGVEEAEAGGTNPIHKDTGASTSTSDGPPASEGDETQH